MTSETDLKRNSAIADARLGVAEELGWPLAILAGLSAYLQWDAWLVGLGVAVGTYLLVTYRYRRHAAQAEDSYFRAAGLGKYAVKGSGDDA